MKRHTAGSEELVCKINYVRDWLNKAQEAAENGDSIGAISKLVLAKADTSNLISMLVPQPVPQAGRHRFLTPAMLRKLAAATAPLVLVAVFFIGMAFSGDVDPATQEPSINQSPAVALHRSVDRPEFGRMLLASRHQMGETAGVTEPDATPLIQKPLADPNVKPVVHRPTPVVYTPEPQPEIPAAVVLEENASDPIPVTADVEPARGDTLDLFGFSMDVIRSARANLSP